MKSVEEIINGLLHKKALRCLDNPDHKFKNNYLDGVRCPWCEGLVAPHLVTNLEYTTLSDYDDLMKDKLYRYKAECLACGHIKTIYHTKDEYQEVRVCSECNGALVDIWRKPKYVNQQTNKRRLIVRCKNGHGFKVKEGIAFESQCPYCSATLGRVKKVNIEEAFNLHFIDREQINKRNKWL